MSEDALRAAAQRVVDGWFGAGMSPDAFDDLRAALASSRPEPMTEFVWLIERGQPAKWWGVTDSRTGAYGWVDSAFAADQFATRQEAEAVIAKHNSRPGHPFEARAVEHGFLRDYALASSRPEPLDDGDAALAADPTSGVGALRAARLAKWTCPKCGWSGDLGKEAHMTFIHPLASSRPEPLDVERLHQAMARTETEVLRQGVYIGRDADLSDYADAIATEYGRLGELE